MAYNLYKELYKNGLHTQQYRKSIALIAAMRLKRHKPEDCLEILSIHDDTDVTTRYVRMLAYAYMKHFDEVFRLLRMTTEVKQTGTVPKIPDQLV